MFPKSNTFRPVIKRLILISAIIIAAPVNTKVELTTAPKSRPNFKFDPLKFDPLNETLSVHITTAQDGMSVKLGSKKSHFPPSQTILKIYPKKQ